MRNAAKLAAHDKWVCLPCRWTAKIELVDVRAASVPSYRCPKCRAKMIWTGTAFRPPRKGDDEGWLVLERILGSGFRFWATARRQRVPRTMKELDPWLRGQSAPDGWLPEQKVRIARAAGRAALRCGRRAPRDRDDVLVWHDGDWRQGELRLLGDGGRRLPSPVVSLQAPRRTVVVSAGTRLRLRGTTMA